jgi:hypothetical protein
VYAVPLVIGRNYTHRIVVIFITGFDVLIEKRWPCDTSQMYVDGEKQAPFFAKFSSICKSDLIMTSYNLLERSKAMIIFKLNSVPLHLQSFFYKMCSEKIQVTY